MAFYKEIECEHGWTDGLDWHYCGLGTGLSIGLMSHCLKEYCPIYEKDYELDFESIADEYDVMLRHEPEDFWCRNGGSSCGETIILRPCDEEYIYEMSFWHELGHILLDRLMASTRSTYMSKMSSEGTAWELGLIEAAKHNRHWDYDSKEMQWAREQMASYVGGEYDDMKQYYKER